MQASRDEIMDVDFFERPMSGRMMEPGSDSKRMRRDEENFAHDGFANGLESFLSLRTNRY